ncbi:MAG: preprotein translocase subunit SecG [Bacteroidetes bacterium]|nr:preprotein translocase subunit SecG [Bacteroidota bacterium]
MYTTFAIIIVIASILLTLVVLVQNSKGGGLAANFAAGNQTLGVRQTADFLEKATWTLALTILVCCIAATAFIATGSSARQSELQNRLENVQTGTTPQFPAPQQDAQFPIE